MSDAAALGTLVASLIERAGIADAGAYLNPIEASNALSAGRAVVVILPPSNTFETNHLVDTEWTLLIAAGPYDNYIKAWPRLDALCEALRVDLGIESAKPTAYAPTNGQEFPALEIKLTISYTP